MPGTHVTTKFTILLLVVAEMPHKIKIKNKTFNSDDEVGIKLLMRLRLGFSHLREHKFRHNFADTLNPP